MSTAEEISLLGFVNTPILVGDPEGCIVYANPSFRSRFCPNGDDLMGQALAMVFGGGAREVVLSALAAVLDRGETAKVQIREDGHGYLGLASPIEAEDDRVGVVMVLLEEPRVVDHVPRLVDELGEPLAEAIASFTTLGSEVNPLLRRSGRDAFEQGMRALEEAKATHRELNNVARGGKPTQGQFDVASAIERVSSRMKGGAAVEAGVELLVSRDLPEVTGTVAAFERLMGQLLRQRLDERKDGKPLTLLARRLEGHEGAGVLVSLVDVPDAARREATGLPPEAIVQGVAAMGGEAICFEDSAVGRVTSMRFAVANASA